MKRLCFTILSLLCLAAPGAVHADTIVLKNGDHLSGTITHADAKQLTLSTEYAGNIAVDWAAVAQANSAGALYVTTSQGKVLNGRLSFSGTNLVVQTSAQGGVTVPLDHVTIIRSPTEQHAYEASLRPNWVRNWDVSADLGLAIARGNSNTTNLSTGVHADRKTLTDETSLYMTSVYTTGSVSGVIANAILGGVRYNKNITPQLFAFGSADYTHDALQDLNLRSIYSGGLGWHAVANPRATLDIFSGLNYTRETYGAAATQVDRNLAGMTLGDTLHYQLAKAVSLSQDFSFYPDLSDVGQYRFAADAGAVTKINSWLGWQITMSDRYVSNPPIIGTVPNDFILSTGINVAFKH